MCLTLPLPYFFCYLSVIFSVSKVMLCHQLAGVPARITHTNLHVNKSLVQIAGQNMTMLCKSDGMPYPDTFWYKVGYH
jgi:hypothetical protein